MKLEDLYKILISEKPSVLIDENKEEIFKLIPELKDCVGFEQHNIWHVYDVYEHILHVVDGVPENLELRLAALFHDVGKPIAFTLDDNGVGHFYGHWDRSCEIFNRFAKEYNLEEDFRTSVSNLIEYHDIYIKELSIDDMKKIKRILGEDGIDKLFFIKRSDLLAQNPKFHDLLEEYDKQHKMFKDLGV